MNPLLRTARRTVGAGLFRVLTGRPVRRSEHAVYWRALRHQLGNRWRDRPDGETRYFVHIPKTAGMSVHAFLRACEPGGPSAPALFPSFFPRDLLADLRAARHYTVFSGHFLGYLDPLLDRTTTKATVLRDPVERALSHIAHAKRDSLVGANSPAWSRPVHEIAANPDLQGNVANVQARWLAALTENTRWLGLPEVPKYTMPEDELLARARAGLAMIEIVGLHERLPEFLQRLAGAWELQPPTTIPRVNIGTNRDAITVTEDDRDLLRALNRVDAALYDEVAARLASTPPAAS